MNYSARRQFVADQGKRVEALEKRVAALRLEACALEAAPDRPGKEKRQNKLARRTVEAMVQLARARKTMGDFAQREAGTAAVSTYAAKRARRLRELRGEGV
jgi:hypothetical protein